MIEALAYIKQGRLTIEDRKRLIDLVLAAKDGQYRLTLSRDYSIRSIAENAYYWGVVIAAFIAGYKETQGETISAEAAHELLKIACNGKTLFLGGEFVTIGQSTAKLVTVEYENYLERCRYWIAQYFGIEVKLPNEK